jgi:hypothetical protein
MRCHHPTKRTRPLLRLVVHVMADGKAVNDTADRTRTAEKSLPPEFALDMPPKSRCHCVPSLGGGDCEWSLMRDSHRDGEMSWNDSWVILVAGMGLLRKHTSDLPSSRGNHYIFVLYHHDTNLIAPLVPKSLPGIDQDAIDLHLKAVLEG